MDRDPLLTELRYQWEGDRNRQINRYHEIVSDGNVFYKASKTGR